MKLISKDTIRFGLIFLVAAVLRFLFLDKFSFWFDEAMFCMLPRPDLN
ncbi:MAG: hypothetical protein GF379_02445, partial [Candidatus Omnitrophica bacterium]|nr:hypothetical protein [Candidatus Omnitrophota bacterium]